MNSTQPHKAEHWFQVQKRNLRNHYQKLTAGFRAAHLRRELRKCQTSQQPIKLMLGAGSVRLKGWLVTDIHYFNILKAGDWSSYLEESSLDRLLAEHVLEHLSLTENRTALRHALKYLKPGGTFRIAVPDGNRPDEQYRKEVEPPADGHQIFFNLASLTSLLLAMGFEVQPLEWFDEQGQFHEHPWDSSDGHIFRSKRYDQQELFRFGDDLYYTSLIVDAIKPKSA